MNATGSTLPSLLAPYKTIAVAEACGVDATTVSAWKMGERVPRDAEIIKHLADFIRIDVADLLTVLVEDGKRLRSPAEDTTVEGRSVVSERERGVA